MRNDNKVLIEIDGDPYCFDHDAYRSVLKCLSSGRRGRTRDEVISELSDKSGIPADDLKLWTCRQFSPANFDTLVCVEEALGISDHLLLVRPCTPEPQDEPLTGRQHDAVKRIYDELVWFLEEFCNSEGFCSWYDEFSEAGSTDPETEVRKCIRNLNERIGAVFCQEYYYLRYHSIYDSLYEFFYEDLPIIYENRIGHRFREEDGDAIPVCQDYAAALQLLNSIVLQTHTTQAGS